METFNQKLSRKLNDLIQYRYAVTLKFPRRFMFRGNRYSYNAHMYNYSWANERCVEIPIFQNLLSGLSADANILEVGNVLSHYQTVHHQVVDKYEKTKGVINQDISEYTTKEKYDLIFSISTLEHVGWDERKKDNNKIYKSLKNMQSMLAKEGEIWFSVPLGYNPFLDKLIDSNQQLINDFYLHRISGFSNLWQEETKPLISNCHYGKPFPHANYLLIASFPKNKKPGK